MVKKLYVYDVYVKISLRLTDTGEKHAALTRSLNDIDLLPVSVTHTREERERERERARGLCGRAHVNRV